MQSKNKLVLLFFIFSVNSVIISAILKMFGLFDFAVTDANFKYPVVGITIKFIILLAIYYFIIGSVTRFEPKKLFFKMLPFFPLTIVLYFIPQSVYTPISGVILFATCLSLIPKFSTIVRFILNNALIIIIQFIIIWLRLDIKAVAATFPNELQFAIMNIDQLIILILLYVTNRRWGDKYGLVVFGRKK
jgi:hypothetical protein